MNDPRTLDRTSNDKASGFTPRHIVQHFGAAKCHALQHEPIERYTVVNSVYVYRCQCGVLVRINERTMRRMQRGFTLYDFAWAFGRIPASKEALISAAQHHAKMYFTARHHKPLPVGEVLVEGRPVRRVIVEHDAMHGSEDLRSTCEAFGVPWHRRSYRDGTIPVDDRGEVLMLHGGDAHYTRRGTFIYTGASLTKHATTADEIIEALKDIGIGDHTTVSVDEQWRAYVDALNAYAHHVGGVEVEVATMEGDIYEVVAEAAYNDDGHFGEMLTDYIAWCERFRKDEKKVVLVGGEPEVDFSKATLL